MSLVERNNPLTLLFEDDVRNIKLAYLAADVSLDDLIKKLRGKNGNIFQHFDYIEGFQKMIGVWQR